MKTMDTREKNTMFLSKAIAATYLRAADKGYAALTISRNGIVDIEDDLRKVCEITVGMRLRENTPITIVLEYFPSKYYTRYEVTIKDDGNNIINLETRDTTLACHYVTKWTRRLAPLVLAATKHVSAQPAHGHVPNMMTKRGDL